MLWFLACFLTPVWSAQPRRASSSTMCCGPRLQNGWESSQILGLLLNWTKTRVYMRGYEKRWFAVARTATKPENMQGFHEDNMLFVVDEGVRRCRPHSGGCAGHAVRPQQQAAVLWQPHQSDGRLCRCVRAGRGNLVHHDRVQPGQPPHKQGQHRRTGSKVRRELQCGACPCRRIAAACRGRCVLSPSRLQSRRP